LPPPSSVLPFFGIFWEITGSFAVRTLSLERTATRVCFDEQKRVFLYLLGV